MAEPLEAVLQPVLELAAGALSAQFDEHRAAAYSQACRLAEKALEAATGTSSTIEALAELTTITSRLTERLEALEAADA